MLGEAARKAAVPVTGPACAAGSRCEVAARGKQQRCSAASFGQCRADPSRSAALLPPRNLLSLPVHASCQLSDACRAFGKLTSASVPLSEAKALGLSLVLQLNRDLNQCGTMHLSIFLWVMHLAVGFVLTYVLNLPFYETDKI